MRLSCQPNQQTSCDQQRLSCCASRAVLVAIVAAPPVLLSASKSLGEADLPSEASNPLLRVDAEKGATRAYSAGDGILGEPAFIPRPGGTRGDDKCVASCSLGPVARTSDLLILEAARGEC